MNGIEDELGRSKLRAWFRNPGFVAFDQKYYPSRKDAPHEEVGPTDFVIFLVRLCRRSNLAFVEIWCRSHVFRRVHVETDRSSK